MYNNFLRLTYFELKKSLCRKGSVITIVLGFLLIALSPFGTLIGSVYDDEGNPVMSKYEDMCIDRDYSLALSGRTVDGDLIMEAAKGYSKIPRLFSEKSYSDTKEYQLFARPYSEIYSMVRRVYDVDYYEFGQFTREQADGFYDELQNYIGTYIDTLPMSDKAKRKVMSDYESVEKPFVYQNTDGFRRAAVISYTSSIIAAIVSAVVFAALFSGEYTSGMDSIVLTSRNGKGSVITAKLAAAFGFTVVFNLLAAAVTIAFCMLAFGANGINASMQVFMYNSVYPIHVSDIMLITLIGSLTACILCTSLTAFFSAKLKTPFAAVIVMMIIIIVPMMINLDEYDGIIYLLFNMLPTNVMAYYCLISEMQYEIFGIVIPPYIFLPICMAVFTAVTVPFVYRNFRRKKR